MLQGLLDQVKRAIFDDPHNPYQENNQPGGLIDQITGLFGQHQQAGTAQNPLPASQDPYGDPADQFPGQGYAYADNRQARFGNVRPASEDPYGDPADQGANSRFPNVRPASEDPYGDPADQERR